SEPGPRKRRPIQRETEVGRSTARQLLPWCGCALTEGPCLLWPPLPSRQRPASADLFACELRLPAPAERFGCTEYTVRSHSAFPLAWSSPAESRRQFRFPASGCH